MQENLWTDQPILWLILRLLIIMCTLTKFCHLKFFLKKWWFFQNVNNLLFISATLSNICCKAYEKTYIFFFFFQYFETFTLFLHVYKIAWSQNFIKKCCPFQYVNKILLIPTTVNNIFHKNYEISYDICNIFLKFVSIFTLWRSFIMTTFLQQKWQLFQCC